MKHITPETTTRIELVQTPDCELTNVCHGNKNGDRSSVKKAHAAQERVSSRRFLKQGRDDVGGGVSTTAARPASELCKHNSSRDIQFPLAVPSGRLIADAKVVVASPEQYAHRPILRRLAWMTLMSQRGLAVNQNRLAQMSIEGLS